MKTLSPIDMRSIHEEIQDRIKEYILVNNLQPEDPLPSETQLAEQLGVSRAVVREALRALESVGVIRSRRGAGRYVSEFNLDPIVDNLAYSMLFDREDVQELLEIRERLEVSFIPDAIAAMTEECLEELRALADEMRRKANAGVNFLDEDLAFHRAMYQVTGNHLLVKLLNIFWDVYQHLRDESWLTLMDLDALARTHESILQAIEAKEVDVAQRCLVDHFHAIEERLRIVRQESGGSAA